MARTSTKFGLAFPLEMFVSGVVQCDLSDHYAFFANFPSNSVLEN